METQKLNLFIVDDNTSMVAVLKQYLQNKFGANIIISTFSDGESCLEEVNRDTHMVILDHFLNGKNGLEVLKLIKEKNPQTEVIMLTSHEDVATAIESFRAGAKDYVVKGPSSWKKITELIYNIISEPVRIIVREFGVTKFTAIFLLTFVIMAIVVVAVLQNIT
ncbi:MAG: response regulator [Bacteroidota bacterium]